MPPVMLVDFKPFLSEKDAIYYSMWDGCCMNPVGERTWLNVQGQEACELFEEDERL